MATGPTGLSGLPGLQGVKGITGVTGIAGIQGEHGNQGVVGPTGPRGDTGPLGFDRYPLRAQTLIVNDQGAVSDSINNPYITRNFSSFIPYLYDGASRSIFGMAVATDGTINVPAGTYLIRASVMTGNAGSSHIRLNRAVDDSIIIVGTLSNESMSYIHYFHTFAISTDIRLQQYSSTSGVSLSGSESLEPSSITFINIS